MEKKEQERLEEILAMCAQYEQQIDSEMQLKSAANNPDINGTAKISSGNENSFTRLSIQNEQRITPSLPPTAPAVEGEYR